MEELNKIKKTINLITERRNRLFIYIIICMVINLILVCFTPIEGTKARHLDGRSATQDEIATATIHTILIGIPLSGFILGTAISLFPYKGFSYSKKYLFFSLVIIFSLEILVLILSLITIIK
jgi:hypothetical protein